jgi:hypothetical protein
LAGIVAPNDHSAGIDMAIGTSLFLGAHVVPVVSFRRSFTLSSFRVAVRCKQDQQSGTRPSGVGAARMVLETIE